MRLLLFLLFVSCIFSLPSQLFADVQNIDLKSGFNSVAMTVAPGEAAKAILTNDPDLESIFSFDETTQTFKFVLKLASGSLFGEDIILVGGKGYFIKASKAKTLMITGTPHQFNAPVALATGFNQIGLPLQTGIKNASGVLSQLSQINQLFRFDAATQTFAFLLKLESGSNFGEDFPFTAGSGYFLKSTAATNIDFSELSTRATKSQAMSKAVVTSILKTGSSKAGGPQLSPAFLVGLPTQDGEGWYTLTYTYVMVEPDGSGTSTTYNYITKFRILAGQTPLSLRDATTTERSTVTQIDILYSFTGSNGETGSLNASFTNLVIPTSLITPLDFSGTVTFTGTCTMNGLTTNISGNGSGGVKMDSEGITPYYNATINYSDTDGVSATAQLSSDGSCTGTVMYQGYTIGTISLDSNGKVTYTETVSGQAVILAEELYQLLQ